MKKRVLSFLLCLLMVLPLLLVSCGTNEDPDDTEEEEELYVKPATLNFYIIGDQVTSDAAIAVEEAFNQRCRELYKTQVNFVYCTASEYEERIKEDLADAKKAFSESGAVLPSVSFENAPVETEIDILNTVIEKYPEVGNNQIDILLITSKEMYDELRAADHLADLTDTVDTSFRDIPQRVNSNLINAAKDGGKLYAIPNNVLIGTYKYVLVNKDIMYLLKYFDTKGGLETKEKTLDYEKLRDLIAQIQACKDATPDDPDLYEIQQEIMKRNGNVDFYPLKAPFAYPTVSFLPKGDEETVFGVLYEHNTTYTHQVALENILLNESYYNHLSLMLEAKENYYYPDPALTPEEAVYGVFYMEGSYTDRFQYEEDYFVYEVDQPRLEDDGAFDAMFAVSKYTASVTRSMEIIDALVADVGGELRNILQYGVESLHYNVDDKTGLLTRTATGEREYMMNANYTGNMITAFPCLKDGRDENYSSYFKAQNDSATRNPLYGLASKDLWETTVDNMVNALVCERIIKQIEADIKAMKEADIEALIGADGEPNAELTSKILEEKIPRGHDFATLRKYWEYLSGGYDPTDTYKSAPNLSAVSLALQKRIDPIVEVAQIEAETFASQAAAIGNDYMKRALACETKAELDALIYDINEDKADPEVMKYLYALREPDETNKLMGMLVNLSQSDIYDRFPDHADKTKVVDFTLAGALQHWYIDIKSSNKK